MAHTIRAVALGLLAVLVTAPQAQARRPAPPDVRLEPIGYRIIVEPDIVVGRRGRVITRSLTWKLREVYRTPGGREIYVVPRIPGTGDSRVSLKRPWKPGEVLTVSRLFRDRQRAVRRFRKIHRSDTIRRIGKRGTMLTLDAPAPAPPPPPPRPRPRPEPQMINQDIEAGPIWNQRDAESKCPKVCSPHRWTGQWRTTVPGKMSVCGCEVPAGATAPPPPPPRPAGPDCRTVLIDKGHHPSHLKKCDGVDQRCAVALLEKGHHPSHLKKCRAPINSRCARMLLDKGHHPTHLDKCRQKGLSGACVAALLEAGHHPTHIDKCRNVDPKCAVHLLESGKHPMHLKNCRR